MKRFKVFFFLLLFLPVLSNGQSVSDHLKAINNEFSRYNSYESSFEVSGNQLVFKNKYGAAYIPFKDIDFRINYKHKSIDIYCLDGSKCIKKGDSYWDYYNVSMVDNNRIANSIFETLDRCREIRAKYVSSEKYVSYGNSEDDLLRYINRQFDLYNKYYSRFEVDKGVLVFSNKFGTSKIPFSDINFKINPSTNSLEFHCKDGGKCINKYDFNGELTTWNYYNVSLIGSDGQMVNEAYKVKEKCDELQRLYTSNNDNNNDYNGGGEVANLLDYINSQFDKYNSVEAKFSVNTANKTLIFSNSMSPAEPLYFGDIDFRISTQHQSIDIYCLDESKCIQKGGSNWDYYNVSMKNKDGSMASEIYTVLDKCKELKRQVLKGNSDNKNTRKNSGRTGSTGSTEGNNDKGGSVINEKSVAQRYLSDINRWYRDNGKAAYAWEIDWANERLLYRYNDCTCYVPLRNTTIRYEYVSSQSPEPHGVDFVMASGEKYDYVCNDGYTSDGEELNTYVNEKLVADEAIQAFKRIQNLVLYGRE